MKPEWNPALREPPSQFGMIIMRGMWLTGVALTVQPYPPSFAAHLELERAAFWKHRRLGVPVVKATYN